MATHRASWSSSGPIALAVRSLGVLDPTWCDEVGSKRGEPSENAAACVQGQRPLKRCSSKDFQQVVIIPTTTAAFHDETCAVGMLFQE